MAQYGAPARSRGIGVRSLLLGLFGLALCGIVAAWGMELIRFGR